jgi:hypothetical protein
LSLRAEPSRPRTQDRYGASPWKGRSIGKGSPQPYEAAAVSDPGRTALSEVVDVMLADPELQRCSSKLLLTRGLAFSHCRRLSSIVDLGRSVDRLAEVNRADRTSCPQGLAWSGPLLCRQPNFAQGWLAPS